MNARGALRKATSALALGFLCLTHTAAQPPTAGGGPPGGAFGDPNRRTEMLLDRLSEDLRLSRDQRTAMKALFERAQTSGKPFAEQLFATRRELLEAVRAGKTAQELAPLHERMGKISAQLVAVQSAAFADALKLLREDQKADADILFDLLGAATHSWGRGGMMGKPGPGGDPHRGSGPPKAESPRD